MTVGAARPASMGEGSAEAAGSAPMAAEATERETVVVEVEVEAAAIVEPTARRDGWVAACLCGGG